MGKVYAVLLAGVAAIGVSAGASAQDWSQIPERQTGRAVEAMPALNAPAAPGAPAGTPAAERTAQIDRPAGALTSPLRPGSGVALAFQVPAGLSVSISTAALPPDPPAGYPGGYSTASGPEREGAGVPPMLGVDLAPPGLAALPPGGHAPASVTLGQ